MARKSRQARRVAAMNSQGRSISFLPGYDLTGHYNQSNQRIDTWSVGGYPDTVTFDQHWNMWRRNGVAKAVIEMPVNACWQEPPEIEGGGQAFIDAIAMLDKKYALWARLRALDLRQRVGRYAGLLLIAKEPGSPTPDKPLNAISTNAMVKMMPVYESQLDVNEWVNDFTSVEYGNPKSYVYKSNVEGSRSDGDNQSFVLDPSRVFVFAEGADDGTIYGIPALEACFNALLDMEKIRAGGGEGYLRNAKQRFVLEVNNDSTAKSLQNAATKEKFDDNVDNFQKGFDNSLIAYGMSAKTLSSTLADPMNPWTIALNEVAASTGIPATILIGQQTGRLASDEDGKQMAKVVMARRQNVLNPMIKALFDRLVKVKLLPAPVGEYEIEWDNMLEATDAEKVDLSKKMADTNDVSVRSGVGAVYSLEEIRAAGGYDEPADIEVDEPGEGMEEESPE